MKIEHRNVNFEDHRGTITDIFVGTPMQHGTIIFSKKGSIRGNHFHKLSTQHDFYISGKVRMLTQKNGTTDVVETMLGPNDFVTIEPNEAHAFDALEDSVFVTFIVGPRGGEDYEKDTYRLEVPLQELWANRS